MFSNAIGCILKEKPLFVVVSDDGFKNQKLLWYNLENPSQQILSIVAIVGPADVSDVRKIFWIFLSNKNNDDKNEQMWNIQNRLEQFMAFKNDANIGNLIIFHNSHT